MIKNALYRTLALCLTIGALTTTFALPVGAAKNGVTPVVPGMDRRVPGRTESAQPGTPNAKTRHYTPPSTNEPTIKPAKIKAPVAPQPATSNAQTEQ